MCKFAYLEGSKGSASLNLIISIPSNGLGFIIADYVRTNFKLLRSKSSLAKQITMKRNLGKIYELKNPHFMCHQKRWQSDLIVANS